MRLFNHAAFHTPLLNDVARQAQQKLSVDMFEKPLVPLIDGQGRIWQPHSTDVADLRDYTLGAQVTQPYDFSAAMEVGAEGVCSGYRHRARTWWHAGRRNWTMHGEASLVGNGQQTGFSGSAGI